MKINWKARFKNPVFMFQTLLSALTPALAYLGLSFTDLVTWSSVWDLFVQAYSNPYLLALIIINIFNTVNDPTVKGLNDSKRALSYTRPRDDKNYIE